MRRLLLLLLLLLLLFYENYVSYLIADKFTVLLN